MQQIYKIISNKPIAKSVFQLMLEGKTEGLRSGQFVNIMLDGCYLRRPISVCFADNNSLTLIYKVVGRGTELLSKKAVGDCLDLLVGLGNGYDLNLSGDKPLLIGGGVGVPPLYFLCSQLVKKCSSVGVILGFNTADEVFYADEFAKLGAKVVVTTVDGTIGKKGFVTDAIVDFDGYTHIYTCGPEPMLNAVYNAINTSGQFSFEERMGCGFGACMGCSCKTKYGNKRICTDGPVLLKEEIIW